MARTFALEDNHRFGRILVLAVLFHLILLIKLDILSTPNKSLLSNKVLAALLNISQESELGANSQSGSLISPKKLPGLLRITFIKMNSPSLPNANLSDLPIKTSQQGVLRRRTISMASHERRDAPYLSRWQAYVEQYGNDHYPDKALKKNIQGDLRLLVAIKKDGSLKEVTIRQTSGSSVLDQAAINIVLKAAPFEPFPPEIGQDTEILEIIRTWQFRGKLSA